MIKKVLVQWQQSPELARRRALREGERSSGLVQQRAIHREDPEFAVAYALATERLEGYPLLKVGFNGGASYDGRRWNPDRTAEKAIVFEHIPDFAELMSVAITTSGWSPEKLAAETAWINEELARHRQEHEAVTQSQLREGQQRADRMDADAVAGRMIPMWDAKAGRAQAINKNKLLTSSKGIRKGMASEIAGRGGSPTFMPDDDALDALADTDKATTLEDQRTDREIEGFLGLNGYDVSVNTIDGKWRIDIAIGQTDPDTGLVETRTGVRRLEIPADVRRTLRSIWNEVALALEAGQGEIVLDPVLESEPEAAVADPDPDVAAADDYLDSLRD